MLSLRHSGVGGVTTKVDELSSVKITIEVEPLAKAWSYYTSLPSGHEELCLPDTRFPAITYDNIAKVLATRLSGGNISPSGHRLLILAFGGDSEGRACRAMAESGRNDAVAWALWTKLAVRNVDG